MTETTAPTAAQAELDRDVDAHADAALPAEPIRLGKHAFTVEPIKVHQLFPFLKLARPIFAALVKRSSSLPSALPPAGAGPGQGSDSLPPAAVGLTGAELEAGLGDAEFMLDLLEQEGPNLVKALAVGLTVAREPVALKATEDAIGDLAVVELVTLLKHFVLVNASFFAAQGLSLPPGLVLGFPGVAPASAAPSGP